MSDSNGIALFQSEELTVLNTWFGYDQSKPDGDETSHYELRFRYFQENSLDFDAIVEATVAHVLLEPVRHRLPSVYGNPCPQGIVSSRPFSHQTPIKQSKVFLFPRRLLSVNWGTQSSDHTTYYAVWAPLYEQFVIIAYGPSSKDRDGYRERALGKLTRDGLDIEAIASIIQPHWLRLRNRFGQGRWKTFRTAGFITEESATTWADEVWPNEVVNTGDQHPPVADRPSVAANSSQTRVRIRSGTRSVLENEFGEPVTKRGELLLTYLQLSLLDVISKEPGNYFNSVNAWISRAAALPPADTCLRQSIDSIPCSLVDRRDLGHRYVSQLTERGKAVLHTDVPIRVRGIGSFSGFKSWSNVQK